MKGPEVSHLGNAHVHPQLTQNTTLKLTQLEA